METSNPIRVAIVGCGGISGAHANAIIANPDRLQLVGGADLSMDKAREMTEKCGSGKAYEDYKQMIEEQKPDLVIICTWPNLHEEQAIASAAFGVPMILCEKSLSMSAESVVRMVKACRAMGTVLVEGFMGRHHPRTLMLEQLVAEGKIGKLRKIRAGFQRPALAKPSWKMDPKFGGTVFDFSCYCVNAIGEFTTELPQRVYAQMDRREDGLIVQLDGMFHYANDIVAIVESSYTFAFKQPLELHGETGILSMQNAWTGSGASGIDLEPDRNPSVFEKIETPTADRAACQLLHLCDCIRTGESPRFTVEESARNHAVIDAMLKSAETGEAVTPVEPELS